MLAYYPHTHTHTHTHPIALLLKCSFSPCECIWNLLMFLLGELNHTFNQSDLGGNGMGRQNIRGDVCFDKVMTEATLFTDCITP